MTGGTTRLRSIIMECLNKAPEARPRPANILSRLEKARLEPNLSGTRRLAKFDTEVLSRQAQAHAERRAMDDLAVRRTRLFESSVAMFESISQPLYEEIADNATSATFERPPNTIFVAHLEGATLGLGRPVPEPDWDGPFDVISSAVVSVVRDRPSSRGWIGRSHSLWFCDAHRAGEYGWYEMAFMSTRPSQVHDDLAPFSRKPGEAAQYFASVYGVGQLAWPVTEIDRDDTSEFMDRWVGWFADAAEKTLDAPTTMPERVAPRNVANEITRIPASNTWAYLAVTQKSPQPGNLFYQATGLGAFCLTRDGTGGLNLPLPME
jgi:serine/threonine-protein kinase